MDKVLQDITGLLEADHKITLSGCAKKLGLTEVSLKDNYAKAKQTLVDAGVIDASPAPAKKPAGGKKSGSAKKPAQTEAEEVRWQSMCLTGYVNPKELKVTPPFSDLFPINQETFERLKESMKADGFHADSPITLWQDTVIDGHTRRQAALAAGIDEVPFVSIAFPDEAAALAWAGDNQRNRRNLTDADILKYIEANPIREPNRDDQKGTSAMADVPSESQDLPHPKNSGKTLTQTAKDLGVSKGTVTRANRVAKHADAATKEAVKDGNISIRQAEQQVKSGEMGKNSAPQTDAEFLQSIPVRSKLIEERRPVFDRDALAYRKVEKNLDAMKRSGASDAKKIGLTPGLFQRRLSSFLLTPAPHGWLLCNACTGKGCKTCSDLGYTISGPRIMPKG